ncbi:MAG: translation initiation factor IF-3 [Verrucomicrobiota bacterium]
MNERIRSPKVRVIWGATGEQLGVMNTKEAVVKAKAVGLDLVEVVSNVDPPVCRIVDYGKFKYEQSKQTKERNKGKTATKMKEVKFRVRIDTHDYNIKLSRAEEFLSHGHKVRLQLQFRGREMAHKNLGVELMERVCQDLKTMAHIDVEPRLQGRQVVAITSPLSKDKQVRKFKVEVPDDYVDEDDEEEEEDELHEEEASADKSSGRS